jgi:formylglycine-generating enzyme required for sulfatase activity
MKRLLILMPVLTLFFLGCSRKPPEDMVLVPAGKFFMGTSKDIEKDPFFRFGLIKPFYADASPMQEINLDAYYIDKYEVSNEKYQEFLDSTGSKAPPQWSGRRYPEGHANRPVGGVSWYDAMGYCKWKRKRLPTEAEWEKAAKGTDKREFPWGNDYNESMANIAKKAEVYEDTAGVGSYPEGESPYGVYNLIGNVWEWTGSWYKPYSGTVYESQRFGEREKVVRGNSVNPIAHFYKEEHRELTSWYSRVYFRFPVLPDYHINDIGFRCAKSSS